MDRDREMKKQTIDFIFSFSEKLRKAIENQEYGEEYIFLSMLKFAYTVLTKEGYLEEHLDELFFPDGFPDIAYKTYGEWRKHIARKDSEKVVKKFFDTPIGRRLRREIDKIGEI